MVRKCGCGYYYYPLPPGAQYCDYNKQPAWGKSKKLLPTPAYNTQWLCDSLDHHPSLYACSLLFSHHWIQPLCVFTWIVNPGLSEGAVCLQRASEDRGFGNLAFSECVPPVSFPRSLLLPALQQAQKSSPELFWPVPQTLPVGHRIKAQEMPSLQGIFWTRFQFDVWAPVLQKEKHDSIRQLK